MEDLVSSAFWNKKKVLVTGHTGFKGGWLCNMLKHLGADIYAFALKSDQPDGIYQASRVNKLLTEEKFFNINNYSELSKFVTDVNPDIIFHLAAQALVRHSYIDPLETWHTNLIGTINLLESSKLIRKELAIISVTTDKVYENPENGKPFVETDPLGGYDPYSSSKAACEIAISSWRRSFFKQPSNIALASVRAGNVIGGGDYSEDRIIPDIIRSIKCNQILNIRNANATRPWQHVCEPLYGYMLLAEKLYKNIFTKNNLALDSAWNFGPSEESNKKVSEVLQEFSKYHSFKWKTDEDIKHPHEAQNLNLSIEKSIALIGWRPAFDFTTTIEQTAAWYLNQIKGNDSCGFTLKQIDHYFETASKCK